jgi:hypothetical protein
VLKIEAGEAPHKQAQLAHHNLGQSELPNSGIATVAPVARPRRRCIMVAVCRPQRLSESECFVNEP